MQVDTALVSISAQNTSRSSGRTQGAAPTPALDLKSMSLRATFDSLTDSNRARSASARTASGHSARHSARQPLSDRHPNTAARTNIGLPLASLSEEPDTLSAHAEFGHSLDITSQSPECSPHKAEQDHRDALPSATRGSSKSPEETLFGGSSVYSSSEYSSSSRNNSSRSSTSLPSEDAKSGSKVLKEVQMVPIITCHLHGSCIDSECCLRDAYL